MILNNFFLFILVIFFPLLAFYKFKKIDKFFFFSALLTSLPSLFICEFSNLCEYDIKGYYQDSTGWFKSIENVAPSWDGPVRFISYFFSIFYPIIKFGDFSTLGIVNRFFFIVFFIFLLQIKFINKKNLLYYYLLFFPSTILYSNIGGKEIGSAILMCLIFYFLIKGKNLLFFSFFLFFYLYKGLFAYLFLFTVAYIFVDEVKKKWDFKYIFIITLTLFILFPSNIKYKIEEKLSYLKYGLFIENLVQEDLKNGKKINFGSDFLGEHKFIISITSLPQMIFVDNVSFLLSPIPELIKKKTHLVQFYENIFLAIILIMITAYNLKINTQSTIRYFFLFIFTITIYSGISTNPGAINRWKYPVVFFYLFCLQSKKIDRNELYKKN
jgi:hypothetical protein